MRGKSIALAILASFLSLAVTEKSLHGATVTATYNGADDETDIHMALHDVFVTPNEDIAGFGRVGRYSWTGLSSNIVPLNGDFHTFCIDFVQDIVHGTQYTFTPAALEGAPVSDPNYFRNPVGGMGTTKANAIRELWGLYYSGLDTNAKVAGFQLAIWKIIYESTGSLDLKTGDFQVNEAGLPDYVAVANDYMAGISDGSGGYKTDHLAPNLLALTSGQFQDELVQVPLPSSFYGGALLFVVYRVLMLRQRRL